MGGTSSKAETRVFQNEPTIPIELSPNLMRTLQGLPIEKKARKVSSTKVSSDEDVDAIVQARVQRELDSHTQKRVTYEGRSAEQVRREAEDLQRRLKMYVHGSSVRVKGIINSTPKPAPDPAMQAKEKAVLDCYRNNVGRPLDCWKEVEDMKLAVREACKNFAAGFDK
ncbi:hypothetical protein HDU97_001626 [Phlyctochytrium planicorne]|nr:hypothetical protein HDU97_001626 [Phlyctochytrium planicorne]